MLMFVSGRKPVEIQCSTISVVAGIGGGINGSDGGASVKPDTAGGPQQGSTKTRKPVYAGGLLMCIREAHKAGGPVLNTL